MRTVTIRKTFEGYVSTWRFTKGSLGDYYAVSNTGKRYDFASEVAFEKCLAAYFQRGFTVREGCPPIVRKTTEATATT